MALKPQTNHSRPIQSIRMIPQAKTVYGARLCFLNSKQMLFLFPFIKCDMHWVAEVFANLLADVLPNTDDVAGGSHLHDLAVVRHTVKW